MRVLIIANTILRPDALKLMVPDYDPFASEPATSADALTEVAGRICYASWGRPNPKTAKNADYIANIIRQQHGSVMEHANATVYISGVTRNLLLEEERHRFLCHSVRSQRYVAEGPEDFAVHPTLAKEGLADALRTVWMEHQRTYEEITHLLTIKGYSRKQAREAARHFLPSCGATEYLVTANLRAWREFITKRMSVHADKEIQMLARLLLEQFADLAPACFQDIQPPELPDDDPVMVALRNLPTYEGDAQGD